MTDNFSGKSYESRMVDIRASRSTLSITMRVVYHWWVRYLAGFLLLFSLISCVSISPRSDRVADFGTKMARQGLWREAEFRWRQALELDPDNYKLINNLAVALEVRGEYEEALELYEKALKMRPGDKSILKNYENSKRFIESQRSDDE